MVSEMYCAEQIVIPEKFSNILKTYAKDCLRTQPYDLLRWSAAYFRCLSLDVSPPVKARYEHQKIFGSLTKGYLKVLLGQIGSGFYIRRDVLESHWSGLCLPEEELMKFLALTRMLHWPQVHWLKLFAVMVGSITENFPDTVNLICELLTDEPEGGSAAVPFWLFRECFKYVAQIDCSEDVQNFVDGRKVLYGDVLEDVSKMQDIPKKLSSTSFKNMIIDYWMYRVETADKEEYKNERQNGSESPELESLPPKHSSSFRFVSDFQNSSGVVQRSPDFDSVIVTLQELQNPEKIMQFSTQPQISENRQPSANKRDEDVAVLREPISQVNEENAADFYAQECTNLLREIGPPWNWLHNFASQNCKDKSYNFLEQVDAQSDVSPSDSSDDDSYDYFQDKFISQKSSAVTINGSNISKSSAASALSRSTFGTESCADYTLDEFESNNTNQVLLDTICKLPNDFDMKAYDIHDYEAIKKFLEVKHKKKILQTTEFIKLKRFIEKADANGMTFHDLNELYDYFIEQASQEQIIEITEAEHEVQNKNVVSIFGESGIEVDNKLLDAKVSERMILGLVDRPQQEEFGSSVTVSDIDDASSISSTSQAITVIKSENHEKHEKLAQTIPYMQQCRAKRRKSSNSQSASSIKQTDNKNVFTCIIPKIIGIGPALPKSTIDKFLSFLQLRSFQQNGLIYPRNFSEDECPNMIDYS